MAPNPSDLSRLSPTNLLRLNTGEESDNPRHATWLELFFDLVFLIGVTTLQWASPNSLPKRVILGRSLLALFSLCLIPLRALSPLATVIVMSLSLMTLNKLDGINIPDDQASRTEI